jgi:hypothetical protein
LFSAVVVHRIIIFHVIFTFLSLVLLALIFLHDKKSPRHINLGIFFATLVILSLLPVVIFQFYTLYQNNNSFLISPKFFKLKAGIEVFLLIVMDLSLGLLVFIKKIKFYLMELLLAVNLIFLIYFFISSITNISSQNLIMLWYLIFAYLLSVLPVFAIKKYNIPAKKFHSFYMYSVVGFMVFSLISSGLGYRLMGPYYQYVFYSPSVCFIILLIKLRFFFKVFQSKTGGLPLIECPTTPVG